MAAPSSVAIPGSGQAQGITQEKPPAEAYKLENVPDKYIIEALEFHDYCETTFNLRQYYDCECLATKYLDKRIERGEFTGRSSIMLSIQNECPDATEAAGARYNECIYSQSPPTPGQPIEEYCECFANRYAQLYESLDVEPNSQTFVALQTQAMLSCSSPSLEQRFYQ